MRGHRVGAVEISIVPDAVGILAELRDVYPEVPADAWDPYRDLYPELFADTGWRLPCACFLIRVSELTILVDAGVGPPGLWGWRSEQEGLLPESLAQLGVGRDEVDVVVLTHLHIDHVGWSTDETGAVYFPRARYLVHREALRFASSQSDRPYVQRCIVGIADRFELLEADVELAPGVTTFPVAGHYPGHLGLRIASDGEEAVLIADAAVHPALLDHPDWHYVSDLDHVPCVETRRRLVDELCDSGALVACGHYPRGGVGRILRKDGRVVWEPAAR